MAGKYAEYKKRRIINFKQRIKELELEVQELKNQNLRLYNKGVDLESEVYYLKTQAHRSGPSIRPRR